MSVCGWGVAIVSQGQEMKYVYFILNGDCQLTYTYKETQPVAAPTSGAAAGKSSGGGGGGGGEHMQVLTFAVLGTGQSVGSVVSCCVGARLRRCAVLCCAVLCCVVQRKCLERSGS